MLQIKKSIAWAIGLLALTQVTNAEHVRSLQPAVQVSVPPRSPHRRSSPSPSPTRHSIPSWPSLPCYRPDWRDKNIIIDDLCKCDYYTPDMVFAAEVECWVHCIPYRPEQVLSVPEHKGSLSGCINACQGSFEKAKRDAWEGVDAVKRRQDDYWFCHAINFIEGELCEFIGEIGGGEYDPWGRNCWQVPGLGSG
ncbi:hypothetical protein HD806DRAFT_524095 [Xylariaceae sp. AK1471]|nr:hypothetical protein HD806DRAFT_524095 [Xylariaceae sp. AK1471]